MKGNVRRSSSVGGINDQGASYRAHEAPVFVDRETGVSTETWDAMVLTGELPPATVHLRTRLPRWR
jgi:hypothetical protein